MTFELDLLHELRAHPLQLVSHAHVNTSHMHPLQHVAHPLRLVSHATLIAGIRSDALRMHSVACLSLMHPDRC